MKIEAVKEYNPDEVNPYVVLEDLNQAIRTMEANGFTEIVNENDFKYYRNTDTNQKAIIFEATNTVTLTKQWLIQYD